MNHRYTVHDYTQLIEKQQREKERQKIKKKNNTSDDSSDSDDSSSSDEDEGKKSDSTRQKRKSDSDEEEDEDDTILSSSFLYSGANSSSSNIKISCPDVQISHEKENIVYGCGNDGTLFALNMDRAIQNSSKAIEDGSEFLWRISSTSSSSSTSENNGENGINKIFEIPSSSLIASGSDNGVVQLWDTRLCDSSSFSSQASDQCHNPACVMYWESNKDYISDFGINKENTTLLATSGDCTLSVFDIRKHTSSSSDTNPQKRKGPIKPSTCLAQSEDAEDELLSLCIMKNNQKVVCGTQEGVLAIYSWNKFEDMNDRFPGHPYSVESLLKIDEDTLLTASSDGMMRIVQIQPNQLLGVLSPLISLSGSSTTTRSGNENFPLEQIQFDCEKRYIGSISHDENIQLWDASLLMDDDDEDDDDVQGDGKDSDGDDDVKIGLASASSSTLSSSKATTNKYDSDDEWEDMDDGGDDDKDGDDPKKDSDDSDSDDSDESDSDDDRYSKKRKLFKTENEKFFEDL